MLENHANEFLQKHFHMPLEVPVRISKRMTAKLGAFQVKYKNRKVIGEEIVMSHNFVLHNSTQTILDVLYHECVHYALYMTGQPYRDSDQVFTDTLKRLGISKTQTYKYKGQSYLYECRNCRYQFTRQVKGYEKRYICKNCRGQFSYKGVVIQE